MRTTSREFSVDGVRFLCEVPELMAHEQVAQSIVDRYYPGCEHGGVGLFTLEPGQVHLAHVDIQPSEWVTRVHVALETNPHCTVTTPTQCLHMALLYAYEFNTRVEHAVSNAGRTPRVHLVFDVRRKK